MVSAPANVWRGSSRRVWGRARRGFRGVGVRKGLVCVVLGHTWSTHRYQAVNSEEHPRGIYRTCSRCGKSVEDRRRPGARL